MSGRPEWLSSAYRPATSGEIRGWSFGRVTAPRRSEAARWPERRRTIEDQAVFGPERDYLCACGKYEGSKYERMICDACGVKLTTRAERWKRFGHIELAGQVPHPFGSEWAALTAFPVLPAGYFESEAGQRLAPLYDSLVKASTAEAGEEMARILGCIVDVLFPAVDYAHRWGLIDVASLARGMALELRGEDGFYEPAEVQPPLTEIPPE